MSDPNRETGVYKTTHPDTGKSIVGLAADAKVVIGSLAALIGLLVVLAGWFNGYVQSQAIRSISNELTTDGSDTQNAYKALLDERSEEIEANLKAEIIRNRDLENKKLDELKGMIWRATSPSRRVGDPEPAWEGNDQ